MVKSLHAIRWQSNIEPLFNMVSSAYNFLVKFILDRRAVCLLLASLNIFRLFVFKSILQSRNEGPVLFVDFGLYYSC